MIITLAGKPGAGKTSVSKLLAERLGMKFYSIGDLLGRMAVEQGKTIDELLTGTDDSDRIVDAYQKKLGETEDNMIVEGKISWLLIPRSFKILLNVDPAIGAQRIFDEKKRSSASRPDEPDYASVEQMQRIAGERVALYTGKFKRLYDIDDYFDPQHFDLVVDTSHIDGAARVADEIVAELKERALIP